MLNDFLLSTILRRDFLRYCLSFSHLTLEDTRLLPSLNNSTRLLSLPSFGMRSSCLTLPCLALLVDTTP